jgi:hypothetical protein
MFRYSSCFCRFTSDLNAKAMTTKMKIRNEFNDKAENLGCNARLGGSGKSPKFFEFGGSYTSDGYEVWFGITMDRFVTLTNKYAELHND